MKTGFEPTTHGFRFSNKFAITLRDIGLPYDGRLGQGLCGGMSLYAKRLFANGERAPADAVPPARGSHLYRTIWRYQLESLFPTTWLRFIRWQARPDVGGSVPIMPIGQITRREWPKLRKRLGSGEPVLLGLIRAESMNPARAGVNHQVLCTGYDSDPDKHRLRLDIYDPNHPSRTVHLAVELGLPGRLRIIQSTGERVRGFFVTAAQ